MNPRLLITMGDVAGIGPEIIARAWPELITLCRPLVVGDPTWLSRAARLLNPLVELLSQNKPAFGIYAQRRLASGGVPTRHIRALRLSAVH